VQQRGGLIYFPQSHPAKLSARKNVALLVGEQKEPSGPVEKLLKN